jgi:hypothetical protein
VGNRLVMVGSMRPIGAGYTGRSGGRAVGRDVEQSAVTV